MRVPSVARILTVVFVHTIPPVYSIILATASLHPLSVSFFLSSPRAITLEEGDI